MRSALQASTDALQHRWRPGTEGAHARLEQFLGKVGGAFVFLGGVAVPPYHASLNPHAHPRPACATARFNQTPCSPVLPRRAALQALPLFAHERAKTDRESTTMLSPWVHMGSISVRFIYYRCGWLGVCVWQGGKGGEESVQSVVRQQPQSHMSLQPAASPQPLLTLHPAAYPLLPVRAGWRRCMRPTWPAALTSRAAAWTSCSRWATGSTAGGCCLLRLKGKGRWGLRAAWGGM